jgi:hypothetical protein
MLKHIAHHVLIKASPMVSCHADLICPKAPLKCLSPGKFNPFHETFPFSSPASLRPVMTGKSSIFRGAFEQISNNYAMIKDGRN